MIVRIGDRIFDSVDTPIVIVVEESERESLASLLMDERANVLVYASYDGGLYSEETINELIEGAVEKFQEITQKELDRCDK